MTEHSFMSDASDSTTSVTIRLDTGLLSTLMAMDDWDSQSQAIREAIKYYIIHSGNCCPACGTSNRPGAQYCDGCGAPLTPEAKNRIDLLKKDVADHPEVIIKLLQRLVDEKDKDD